MSNSLQPHKPQHVRLPCPSLFPQVCSNSCPLSWWYHPTISSPVAPFSSCPPSFPESGSLPKSHLFTSGGQSIGSSVSASVFPMNILCWFPLELAGLISLLSKGLSRVFLSTSVRKHQFFGAWPIFIPQKNRDSSIWEAIFFLAQTHRYSPGPGITGAAKNKIKCFLKPSVQKSLLKGSTFTIPHFQVRHTMTELS